MIANRLNELSNLLLNKIRIFFFFNKFQFTDYNMIEILIHYHLKIQLFQIFDKLIILLSY